MIQRPQSASPRAATSALRSEVLPPVLMAYQAKWAVDESPVKVLVKCHRSGLNFAKVQELYATGLAKPSEAIIGAL